MMYEVVMDRTDYFDLSHLTAVEWAEFVLFVSAALFFLVRAALTIQGYSGAGKGDEKLHASVITGLYGSGFWLFTILSIFIVLWANLGLKAAVVYAVFLGGCSLPLMFGVVVIGSYIQLGWTDKLRGVQNAIWNHESQKRKQ